MKRRVSYYHDPDIGLYHYGAGHPMKPHRLTLTHELVTSYGLYRKMSIYRPHDASDEEMQRFHSQEYIEFLRRITPDNFKQFQFELEQFGLGRRSDCPVFDGMYDYSRKAAGGSIDGALRLVNDCADVVVNWSGGLHHAKKSEASGFCYVNDIVLAVLELLKYYDRVLYVDIDVHHGDGVEEAFYDSGRVMTVSFHKYGEFFPGTGSWRDVGTKEGKGYSINFPLDSGMDDGTYERIFTPIIDAVVAKYRPGAIVLQCGADSLAHDRLGVFNLSTVAHGKCVKYMMGFNVPLMLLGGGGYTVKNVARCWAYETSVVLNADISNDLPYHEWISYYKPEFKLHVPSKPNVKNCNSVNDLTDKMNRLLEQINNLEGAPNVEFQERAPPTFDDHSRVVKDSANPDARMTAVEIDENVAREGEFYEHDKDQDGDTIM